MGHEGSKVDDGLIAEASDEQAQMAGRVMTSDKAQGSVAGCKQKNSGFDVLVGLDPEVELDQHLQSLKQQVQVIPDLGRKSSEELACEMWGSGQIKQKDRVGKDFGSGDVGSSESKAES